MVKLADSDIRTREVLEWKGVHVFHSPISSCSQKLRIFLNLKKTPWHSRPVDLMGNENITEWYLGINPRGLVPVLVHDGDVHIESNDILLYLEKVFPEPPLIPIGMESKMAELLRHEDDLHLDFRALSFRFLFAPPSTPKTPDVLERYAASGSGTVNGQEDAGKAEQIAFWEKYAKEGIPDSKIRSAAEKFRDSFNELENRLQTGKYLLGDQLTVLDIAWFIYVNRMSVAGYPLARLHPRLAAWFKGLQARPEFTREVEMPQALQNAVAEAHRAQAAASKTMEDIAGPVLA